MSTLRLNASPPNYFLFTFMINFIIYGLYILFLFLDKIGVQINMSLLESNKVVMNMWLFRMFHLYDLFRPGCENKFGLKWNSYQLFAVSIMFTAQFLTAYASLGLITHRDESINEIVKFQLMYFYTMNALCFLKLMTLVYRANDIWDLFDVTCIYFLTSEGCQKHVGILHKYFNVTVKITNLLTVLSIATFTLWIVFPLIRLFFSKTSISATASFNENIINLRFPVSVSVYNNNYFLFYTTEFLIGITLELTTIIFDIFFILFCCAIIAQYEIVSRAYKNIGYERKSQNDDGKSLITRYIKSVFKGGGSGDHTHRLFLRYVVIYLYMIID